MICDREGCVQEFERTAHNMKYCSPACRKIVSGKKVSDRYHRIKDSRSRKPRACESCGLSLSIYNYDRLCSSCDYAAENINLLEIIRGIDDASK